MDRAQYWTVKKTHAAAACNDSDTYAIVNGAGKTIASFCNEDHEKLTGITDAHNLCFISEAAKEE